MVYKVLSTSPTFGYYTFEPVEYLKSHSCEVKLAPQGEKMTEEKIIESARESDALIVGVEKITERVIEASKKLKIIAKHGAGVDNIDMKAASNKGITVINAAGANSDAVADLTVGLLLSVARSIPFADRSVKSGKWLRIAGVQLNGKVLGIIGLGQVGKKIAKRVSGFDIKVLAHDVFQDNAYAQKWGITYVSLAELLAKSDFVSIHVPLIPETRRLLGERELQLMKRDAFLLNLSRGDIVDEEALYRGLKDGRIRGAALDVFLNEPPMDSPLLGLDNVVLTPHMGGYTLEALRETGMICARGIVNVLEERVLRPLTNLEVRKNSIGIDWPVDGN